MNTSVGRKGSDAHRSIVRWLVIGKRGIGVVKGCCCFDATAEAAGTSLIVIAIERAAGIRDNRFVLSLGRALLGC